MKDTTKDCRCTPDIFLDAFKELVDRCRREIEVFTIPYYEEVFPILTTDQLDALHQQIDSIHAAANKFYNQVKGLNQCEQSTKQEL